jgi:hypothetical protein
MDGGMRTLVRGLLAGAAGTTALDAVTYLDMAIRGRPASETPQQTVQRLADLLGVRLGEGKRAENRRAGIGALLGYAVGAGTAAVYGVVTRGRLSPRAGAVVLSAMALVAANGPMVVLGVTDPRQWTAADWAADIVPHLAYGVVAAETFHRLR